jgi:hypothetical protein
VLRIVFDAASARRRIPDLNVGQFQSLFTTVWRFDVVLRSGTRSRRSPFLASTYAGLTTKSNVCVVEKSSKSWGIHRWRVGGRFGGGGCL